MPQYVRNGDVHVAYRVDGTGPRDLLYISGQLLSVDDAFENPHMARLCTALMAFGRLIQLDPRGVGYSDVGAEPVTIDHMVSDALAVLDAVGSTQAVVIAANTGAPLAVRLAVAAPERVSAMVVIDATARTHADTDYAIGFPEPLVREFIDDMASPDREFESPIGGEIELLVPSLKDDPAYREWVRRSVRRASSPAHARRMFEIGVLADLRGDLPRLDLPVLVLARRHNQLLPVAHSRYLAEHIAGSKLVELPGADHVPYGADSNALVAEIEEFVTGVRRAPSHRVLTTILFTDIVDSTRLAATEGDTRWRARLDAHDAAVRNVITRYDGREVNTTGDGFVAMFDLASQAIAAARAITVESGVPVRAGIHTGECERRGDDLAGMAVHIAARVASQAGAGEVLVSQTVRDLVTGSELQFADRGDYELKGVPDAWRLFAVEG